MKEIEFKGSPLETTLKQVGGEGIAIYYEFTQRAFYNQPESKFWKDAYELMKKRYDKINKL